MLILILSKSKRSKILQKIENNDNNNNNNNIVKRGKRKTDQLSLPKKNLADTWVATSPPKGGSPAKTQKVQKIILTSPDSSEVSSIGSMDPSFLDGGIQAATEMPLQIIAAKPMQLLTEIRYKEVEMLVHSAKEMLANKQQIRPIWVYLSQRAQDQLSMRVQARKSNVNSPDVKIDM